MLDETKEVLTIKETAQVLRVCEVTVIRGIKAGKIPSIRLGDRHLIPTRQLNRLLAGEV